MAKHLVSYPSIQAALDSGNFDAYGALAGSVLKRMIESGEVKIKAPRVNKWLYEIIVQEWTGYEWEDACAESSLKDARATKKDYQRNGFQARIINRRTPNPDYVAK